MTFEYRKPGYDATQTEGQWFQ